MEENMDMEIADSFYGETSNKIVMNHDIMEEILLKLPLKSLYRCKVLSKSLHDLISSDMFFKNYLSSRGIDPSSPSSHHLVGFFTQSDDNLTDIQYLPATDDHEGLPPVDEPFSFLMAPQTTPNIEFDSQYIYILASSNGFLLCRKELSLEDRTIYFRYYVCNPVTKQYDNLPTPPILEIRRVGETLMCQGNNYPCLDRVKYKVVRCLQNNVGSCYLNVEIYSSETDEWVELVLNTGSEPFRLPTWTECCHSEKGMVCFEGEQPIWITCFLLYDVHQKAKGVQFVGLPPVRSAGKDMRLGQSQGSIQYMIHDNQLDYNIQIWQLNEDYNCETRWFLKHTYNVVQIERQHLPVAVNNLQAVQLRAAYLHHIRTNPKVSFDAFLRQEDSKVTFEAFHPLISGVLLINVDQDKKLLVDTIDGSSKLISKVASQHYANFYYPYNCPSWIPQLV